MDGREGYDAAAYGDRIADVYDELPTHPPDVDAAAAFLADLAGPGPALELAIGTGRLALPLAERGVAVSGIDASERWSRSPGQAGGERIPVAIGTSPMCPSMVASLICVVYNTLFAPSSTRNVAASNESLITSSRAAGSWSSVRARSESFERDQHVEVRHAGDDAVLLSVSRHDAATKRRVALVRLGNDSIRTWPVRIRYSYLSELDLMAEAAAAGSSIVGAAGNRSRYRRQRGHVSVYCGAAA